MPEQRFAIIDDGRPVEVTAEVEDGRVWLRAERVQTAFGWDLKAEGLCRGDVCIPLPPGISTDRGRIDLADVAAVLRRPLALDIPESVAYLGTSPEERGAALATLVAPDFSLPDLEGRLHTLSDQRGKKVLLVVYASW